MRYAMRSRADATSAEACRTFQNLAIHPSCHGLLKGWGAMAPDSAAELLFAVLPEAAVLLAAQHGLPVRTVHPGSHGLLRHRIQDPGGPDVRLLHSVGLLHDLDSLGLHQAVDAHFAVRAGSDLPVGGELKGVVGRDIRRPAGCCFEIDQPPFHIQYVHASPDRDTSDLTLHIEFDRGGFPRRAGGSSTDCNSPSGKTARSLCAWPCTRSRRRSSPPARVKETFAD